MTHNSSTSSLDFSYIAVLLLLAYVMSSAPKYIQNFRENHNNIKIENVSPVKQVLRFTKYYAVDPYLRAFNSLTPHLNKISLASLNSAVSR